ncbi:MAG: TrmJ/YjtD family RNA methyltransferase [Spirochaetota bacterium]|jgi:tRNA/rRNA methyltransferase|nr:TrmJ/YjtD family RNA methyltransferase [Spirochaetota bacterium]
MRIRCILSHPAVPENVGAAARALVTCGFDELALVAGGGTGIHRDPRARYLAVGAETILDNARIYPSLQDAVAGCDLVIGTTARHRSRLRPVIESRALAGFLAEKQDPDLYAALVFGSEQNGLTNEELLLCHIVAAIPIAQPYPSLNLAQAVMVFAYELARAAETTAQEAEPATAPDECSLGVFMQTTESVLAQAGISREERVYARVLEYAAHCDAHEMGVLFMFWRRLLSREKQ